MVQASIKMHTGEYALGREGGHSEYRILHHKDVTGKEMERALLDEVSKTNNIEIYNHCFVIDIITQHHLRFFSYQIYFRYYLLWCVCVKLKHQ
ncbi:MAG: hypothetical protein V9E96_06675 [Chitinophagaceae bacterium]